MKLNIAMLGNIKIKTKLLITIVTVVLIPLIALALFSTNLIDEGIGGQAQTKIVGDLGAAHEIYSGMEKKLQMTAYFVANKGDIQTSSNSSISKYIQSVKSQYPFISTIIVTDSSGKVIARSNNPSQNGDILASDPFVASALKGKDAGATAIVQADELARDKLEEQAKLELIPTDGAMATDKKVETSGMMIKASSPIYSDGKIAGTVVVGHLINRDFTIVDETKNAVKVETSTIFMNDLRVSTNVKKLDGNRAIGTRVSIPIYNAVMRDGKTYYGRAFVVNAWYVTGYEPIYDIDKKVIGILYVGTPEAPFVDLKKNAQQNILLIGAGSLIFAMLLGLLMSNKLIKPIYNLVNVAEEIADGKLKVNIQNTSGDEIGTLSNKFQTMANDLQAVIEDVNSVVGALSEGDLSRQIQVKAKGDFEKVTIGIKKMQDDLRVVITEVNDVLAAMSEGDLTREVHVEAKGEFGKITTGIKNMQNSLHQLITTLKNSAEKVAFSSRQLSASSEEMKNATGQVSVTTQDIANGVNQQASKLAEISKAMREMSNSIQQVSVNSQKAAEGADNANKTAKEVGGMSGDVLHKMSEIRSSVDDSSAVIKELETKSQKIGEIIGVITGIADQTNLLALNAAIEAARAGNHGRGFAVVADEVRKLAEESRSAAGTITELIKEIQHGTKQAVESMDRGTKKVGEGTGTVENAVTAINSIVKASEDVATMVQEIAAASEQQSVSVSEITSSIEEVSAISEESSASTQEATASAEEQSASMEQLAKAAQELAELSEELKAEVAKFNLGKTVPTVNHVDEPSWHETKPPDQDEARGKKEHKTVSDIKNVNEPPNDKKRYPDVQEVPRPPDNKKVSDKQNADEHPKREKKTPLKRKAAREHVKKPEIPDGTEKTTQPKPGDNMPG